MVFLLQLEEKKSRVNAVMQKLLAPIPSRNRLDVTYLLEGGSGRRTRKKAAVLYT